MLREQAGHMDAPDRCALPPEISCTAGAVHTWLNGQIIAHYAGAGAVRSIRSMGHYKEVAQALSPPNIELSSVIGEGQKIGDILWEMWVLGIEQAMRLCMIAWEQIGESSDEEAKVGGDDSGQLSDRSS